MTVGATMTPIAKTLSTDDTQKLANYFGQQLPMSSSGLSGQNLEALAQCVRT